MPDSVKPTPPQPPRTSNFWTYAWKKVRQGGWRSLQKGLGGLRDEYLAYIEQESQTQSAYVHYETIVSASRDDLDYYIMLISSCLIATFGLLQNSPAVIIGAMIVAPLMGPISGFSAAVLWGRLSDITQSLFTLLKSMIIVLGITVSLSWLLPRVDFLDQLLARTSAGLFDIGVALASGFVGAYGAINKKVSASLSGVAIAVALMPPLCTVGIALGRGLWQYAGGAFLMFGINILGISLAALFVFWIFGLHPVPKQEKEGQVQLVRRALGQIVISLIALVAIAVPMVTLSNEALTRDQRRTQAEAVVRNLLPPADLGEMTWVTEKPVRVRILVYGPISEETLNRMDQELKALYPEGIELKVFSVGEVPRSIEPSPQM